MFLPRCCTSAIRFSFHRWTPVMAVSRINCPAHAISSSRRFVWMNVSREVFRVAPGILESLGPMDSSGFLLPLVFFQQKKRNSSERKSGENCWKLKECITSWKYNRRTHSFFSCHRYGHFESLVAHRLMRAIVRNAGSHVESRNPLVIVPL